MTVYDYVKVLASERHVDIKTIEIACDFGNGTISKWGNSVPKADKLFKVASYFDMPIEYFLTGVRPMMDKMEQVLLNAYRATDERGKARIIQVCMNELDAAEKGENVSAG